MLIFWLTDLNAFFLLGILFWALNKNCSLCHQEMPFKRIFTLKDKCGICERKILQLLGQITHLEQKKIYSKVKPEFYQKPYYKLQVLTTDQRIKDLYVFANLLKNQHIWTLIEQAECFNKSYLFFYQKGRMAASLLVDWKELNEN